MADVEWIKITTDMFDNRKIKHMRKLPEGNNIVLIWVMLLTMAGRCNSGGMIFLTENIPYTPKMLADELSFEESTVRLALQILADLNMIVIDGDYFAIAGWSEYQNIEGMERMREQNRLRKQKQREKQRLLTDMSRDSHVTVTQCHAVDIEEDKDIDIEKEIYIRGDNAPPRSRFIPPTVDEVKAYCEERGNTIDAQTFVDYYETRNWFAGKAKMKNWKAAIRTWENRRREDSKPKTFKYDDHVEEGWTL